VDAAGRRARAAAAGRRFQFRRVAQLPDAKGGHAMSDVRDKDRLDDKEIDRAVEAFFSAVAGLAMLQEGRATLLRVKPEHQNAVITRAIDKLQKKLPKATRGQVEAAIKRDFMRLFDIPTDGNA
jgi:hypothetical protein